MRNILYVLICFIFVTGCDNSTGKSHRTILSCMGASSAYPFFNILFTHYEEQTGNDIRSDGYNNESGLRSLQDKTIDFVISDVFLSDEELQRFSGEVLHVPVCLGAIVLAFNIPGVSELNLSGSVIAGIFLNKITYWDDVRIEAINSGVALPHLKIKPIGRLDGSGANYIFSDYLSRESSAWNESMGRGKTISWTSVITVDGNTMASELVRTVSGAIGYISLEHATILDLKTAAVQNNFGNFIEPAKESILAAANRYYPDDTRVLIANSDREEAYPLSCISWILAYKNQAYAGRKIQKYEALRDLLYFSIDSRQQRIASGMSYVALPEKILDKSQGLIESMIWEE